MIKLVRVSTHGFVTYTLGELIAELVDIQVRDETAGVDSAELSVIQYCIPDISDGFSLTLRQFCYRESSEQHS